MKAMGRLFFPLIFIFTFFCFTTSPVFASLIYDMADDNNWNIRVDGAEVEDRTGNYQGETFFADINSDGKQDLVVSAPGTHNNDRVMSGSIYIILNPLLSRFTGTGNIIDLSKPSNWNLRIDGAQADPTNHYNIGVQSADVNNNGILDLVIRESMNSNEGRTNNGSVFIVNDNLIGPFLTGTTGNILDLAEPTSWNLRIDGNGPIGSFGDVLCYEGSCVIKDISGDGKPDLLVAGMNKSLGNYNGAVYLLYNSLLVVSTTGNILDLADPLNFNIKFTPQTVGDFLGFYGSVGAVDLYNSGEQTLLLGAPFAAYNGRFQSGAIYVIPYHFFSNLTGKGNIYSLTNTANYFVRYDGSIAKEWLGDFSALLARDIDNNGKPDLLIGTIEPLISPYGHIYIIKDSIIDTYTGVGNNIDLLNPVNYNIDLTAINVPHETYLGFWISGDVAHDHFGLGNNDLILAVYYASNNSKLVSGSVYVVPNSLLNSYNGTGKHIDLGDINYALRYDGATAGDNLELGGAGIGAGRFSSIDPIQDFNSDGKSDLILSSTWASNNSRSLSGSVYIIYNFPHTISVTAVTPTNDNTPTVTGSISAPNSVTNISGVQYQVNSNAITGTWTACTATDGSFNSTSESFSCSLSSLDDLAHTIYFRSYDANTSYTAQSAYASISVTTDTTDPNGFTWQTLSRSLKSGNDLIITVADGGFTSDHTVALSWKKEGDATSGIESYKVYYREKGDKKWILIDEVDADTDFVWVDEDPGEYEWYVKAIDYAGNETDSEIFTFTIVDMPEGAPKVDLVNGVAPVSGNVHLGWSDALTVEGTADNESGVVVAIYDPVGQTRYQEILCVSDSAGFFTCTDVALMNSSYLLKIFSRNEVGDEGPITLIMINGSFASYSAVPSEPSGSAPSVPGATTQLPANSSPASSAGRQLAPGIVRGAVDIDTSINPTAINNPGIVSGAVDFPSPELAPEPPRQNILQRIWNSIFH